MICIVSPAHNEKALIMDCLGDVLAAVSSARLKGDGAAVMVVADACTDATGIVAARAGAMVLTLNSRNVGPPRAAGAEPLLVRGARWLAFTDAATTVSPDWLAEQLALHADVVCGPVGVADWSPPGEYAEQSHWDFSQTYFDVDERHHVHGANLGVSASANRRAGGFRHLACSEDVALVQALQAGGARIAWSARPRVTTSTRRIVRISGRFADALGQAVALRVQAASAGVAAGAAA